MNKGNRCFRAGGPVRVIEIINEMAEFAHLMDILIDIHEQAVAIEQWEDDGGSLGRG